MLGFDSVKLSIIKSSINAALNNSGIMRYA